MRGQRCREYAMTVIGMVGRGTVQGDAIREARAVNDDWKSVSSASLYRALKSLREDSGMVTLCMKMVSGRIAAEAAAAPVAVPQMTTPTAPRLSKDEGRAKWARVDDEQVGGGHGVGPEARPQEDHPQQPWYPQPPPPRP